MSLNVIALISGGKDSFFSILHCKANGHRVVALANLYPPAQPKTSGGKDAEGEGEDINSFMYQTVGHSVIPLYEEALDIPLYRQEITGSAINTQRDYTNPDAFNGCADDETESLIPLIKKVREKHPEANAISTGAILSTYQRTRVESVALRLGLMPLSFLWQYPFMPPYSQSALLHDMARVGQDSRIIKVASGGLDESFLDVNVADPKTVARLHKAMARFGTNGDGAVLGEGGEYETLAINGPSSLWKKRIIVEGTIGAAGDGGEALLLFKKAEVVEKGGDDSTTGSHMLRVPDLWDEEFNKVLAGIEDPNPLAPQIETPSRPRIDFSEFSEEFPEGFPEYPRTVISFGVSTINFGNVDGIAVFQEKSDESPYPYSISTEMYEVIRRLLLYLDYYACTPEQIVHATLLLRTMDDFPTINPIYGKLFKAANPPSRVTVACGENMPPKVNVMLSVIISPAIDRQGLHVQGRSYWAPANIGPYSQAISIPHAAPPLSPHFMATTSQQVPNSEKTRVVYMAGQIPLVPATMELFNSGFKEQTALSLQHLWRIGRAQNVSWWPFGVAYISACADHEAVERVRIVRAAWNSIHQHYLEPSETEDEDTVDPWDMRNLSHSLGANLNADDKTFRAPIPDPEVVKGCAPPMLVAQIAQLPRGADIEWWSAGLSVPAGVHITSREDVMEQVPLPYHETRVPETSEAGARSARFVYIEITSVHTPVACWAELLGLKVDIVGEDWEFEHFMLFYSPALRERKWVEWVSAGLQWIPCQRVWGRDGREVLGVVVGRMSWLEKGRALETVPVIGEWDGEVPVTGEMEGLKLG